MFASFLISVVDFGRKFAAFLAVLALLLSVGLGVYAAQNTSINTDINQLLSETLDWRKREKALEAAFPQKVDTLVIVIDSDDAAKAESAAQGLANGLAARTDMFSFVSRPDALPFFRANGLLFLSKKELAEALDQIAQAQPMLGTIISDPSLRGFFDTIDLTMQGVQAGAVPPKQVERPLAEIAKTLQATLQGQDHSLDWLQMAPEANDPFAARELRKYIVTKPVLDYSSLQPGEAATKVVRQIAADLNLTPSTGVRVRLTGSVPLNDEEFASVAEGAGVATALCGVLVFGLLFLAMRSWRIVLPIALTLVAGLIASTAFATAAVGSLNLISVAFAVMFIGIAVDFGIQFGGRYRDQRNREPDHAEALRNTAKIIASPLAMAAGSTALGFLAFIPTDYRGVSELGLIAGVGMMIAFILNITLLPALMTLMNPPAEAENIGFKALAPLNDFLVLHHKAIAPFILALVLAGLAVASQIRFDFDPLDLKNPKSESVSTMFEAMQDPDSDAYAAQILAQPEETQALASSLEKLPEVDHVMTLASFVPEDQDKKLAMIADTASLLAPTFALAQKPAASYENNLEALRKTAALARQIEGKMPAAQILADVLDKIAAQASPELLKRAQDNLLLPMQAKLVEIQGFLRAKSVTSDDIPPELKRDWVAGDGQKLIEVFPKRGADNNPRNPEMLNRFIDAVQKIAPQASGTPVSIRESGRTIVSAFVHAGIYGFASIAFLSFLVLRRCTDVVLMMLPLVVAGILTLATATLIGLPLNFANIIALPLLFSLGVSYAVYFVFYGRSGNRDFLQSSMARAVLFSAATVLVAFASLCFSSHTGTRGMGELLTISLLYSLLCTFFILPVLYAFRKKDTLP
jgi:hopanoid biosynthesis associated RND transporter like protein HpnN